MDNYYGGMPSANYGESTNLARLMTMNSNNYLSFQNFLRHSVFQAENLHPDADGIVKVTFDSHRYATGIIVALDEKSSTQQTVDLHEAREDIEKKSFALDKPLDVNKYYNEMRSCELAKEGDSVIIEDITSTEHMIVDSLDKVKKVQDEVIRILGKSSLDDDLEFLLKWNTLEEEEKNKKYSKFCCHEVNLFLYFKDPEYFKAVVRPFLLNKMEKEFLDHWLLGNFEELAHFAGVEQLDQLNALEKTLLVHSLASTDLPQAERIAQLIKMRADNSDYTDD